MKHKIKTFLYSLTFIAATASQAQAYGEPYCREYTEVFQIGGRSHQGYGTACLQPDGSWEKQGYDNYNTQYEQQKQNVVYVIDRQPVQIIRPHYRPIYRPYAYAQPSNFFSVSFGDSGYRSRPYYGHGGNYGNHHNRGWGNKRWHRNGEHHGRGH